MRRIRKLVVIRIVALTTLAVLAACADTPTEPADAPAPAAAPSFSVGSAGGLFAWWPADGHANDVVGGNHGTLANGAGFAPGKLGQAFTLDGDDYVIGTAPALPQGSAPRTLHAWVFPHTLAGAQTVFSYGTFATNQRNGILLVNGRLYFVGEGNDVIGNTTLPVNQWSQVAITLSGDQIAMYINGALDRAATLPRGPHNTTGTTWTIGRGLRGSHYPEWFRGMIDEVAVYDRLLSPAEIQTVFLTDAPLPTDATAPVITVLGNEGSYTVDQQVEITCTATDDVGVESTTCPTVASGPAYSFGLGASTFTASASDAAGNTADVDVTFTVSVDAGSLCTLVEAWVSKAGVAKSMCKQLDNGAYKAFRNHVRAQTGKSVPADKAAILIDLSNGL